MLGNHINAKFHLLKIINIMIDNTLDSYTKRFNELKTIFDSLPDGIVAILDKDMKIASANEAILKLFNLPYEKIIGSPIQEVFNENFSALFEVIEQTIKKQKPVRNFTIEFVDRNGNATSFLASTAIIKEIDKADTGIVLILHDVSEISKLRKMAVQIKRYGEIVGDSESMKSIYSMIDAIKNYDTSVLIVGETGTGKELVARAIHDASDRKNKPFIPVNCSALPYNLIESELFGHVKGAFTGAITNRPGRFQLANEGTLLLDEVGTLSLELQVKLLRAIQNKIIEPVGSSKNITVNVRIISASNRNLSELVDKNEFREDLLYRLKVIQITIPPLRNRKEDIPLLVNHFVERLNHYYNKNVLGVSHDVMNILNNYPWPGNVRELENTIEHAFVLTTGSIIEVHTLPLDVQHFGIAGQMTPPKLLDLNEDEERIRKALISSNGNLETAASLLQMHRSTLWRKMKEFRISKGFGKIK